MLGKLTIDALPFYSWVAMSGALVTIGGGLAVMAVITWFGWWRTLWTDWLTSVDHKRIGIMYGAAAIFFFIIGGVEALLIRMQLWAPRGSLLSANLYNQVYTMHGTTMVFLVVMPIGAAFANYLIPLQIGARDVAFPRINAFSFWAFLAGGVFLNSSWLLGGGAAGDRARPGRGAAARQRLPD